jgi:hypothetical protein
MKNLTASFALVFLLANILSGQEAKWQGTSVDFNHGRLEISENKRFLTFEDGTPFFILVIQDGNCSIDLIKMKRKSIMRIAGQKALQLYRLLSWQNLTV